MKRLARKSRLESQPNEERRKEVRTSFICYVDTFVDPFASPDLCDNKAHHEGFRVPGNLLTRRQCLIEFHFRKQLGIENALAQGGRKLNRESHIGMSILQGDHCCSDAYLLQSRLSQHTIGALSCIEVPTPLLEGGQNRAFEAIPGLMLGKTVPAGSIWLLYGPDTTSFGAADHLTYHFPSPTS